MRRKVKSEANSSLSGPLAAYAETVLEGAAEAIHDVIVRRGPAVLERGISYLIVAARWRHAEVARTEKRRRELLDRNPSDADAAASHSVWDPYEIVSAQQALRRVADVLGELPDPDVLVIWRNAQGVSDEAIAIEWDERGFQPKSPSLEFIRKRRERARELLKERLASERA